MQNARQNYVEIVLLVMGAMCCQPAETYGTLSSRQFRYTLPLGKMPDLVSVTPSELVLAPSILLGRLRRRQAVRLIGEEYRNRVIIDSRALTSNAA